MKTLKLITAKTAYYMAVAAYTLFAGAAASWIFSMVR